MKIHEYSPIGGGKIWQYSSEVGVTRIGRRTSKYSKKFMPAKIHKGLKKGTWLIAGKMHEEGAT